MPEPNVDILDAKKLDAELGLALELVPELWPGVKPSIILLLVWLLLFAVSYIFSKGGIEKKIYKPLIHYTWFINKEYVWLWTCKK